MKNHQDYAKDVSNAADMVRTLAVGLMHIPESELSRIILEGALFEVANWLDDTAEEMALL